VDVLLTEMDLPGSSAVTLLTTVLRANRSMKAAAHTHNRNPDAMFTALGAGATGYLIKNDRPKLLTDAVQALVEGGSPISPAMASHLIRSFVPANLPVTSDELSARERQILDMIRGGLIRKEVAARLNLSVHTIHAHMKNIQRKLHPADGPKPSRRMQAG
jgi:DNA-binding NarL/FixJ family response regulator